MQIIPLSKAKLLLPWSPIEVLCVGGFHIVLSVDFYFKAVQKLFDLEDGNFRK